MNLLDIHEQIVMLTNFKHNSEIDSKSKRIRKTDGEFKQKHS